MKLVETGLPGCLIIEPRVIEDGRGYFYESWNQATFAEVGLSIRFMQGNVSRSARGVLRGLHYQWPNPQGKLVSVLDGEVWDVAVDIRRGSPTFGQWTATALSGGNKRHFWIPEGFAHGFVVMTESALFSYQCTAVYDAKTEAAICWKDPRLGVDWPVQAPLLSAKDAAARSLADIPENQLPVYRSQASR